MKTVVFGLFEDLDATRRVLRQLADSPLDLDSVTIVHADPDVQRSLGSEVELPPSRAVPTGLLTGALLGGAAGAVLGTGVLAMLGPLLSAAGGLLLGGLGGAAVAALAEPVRLPLPQSEEMSAAVDAGATALMVRTSNAPTARAIRNLFHAGGSRALDDVADDLVAGSPFAPPADPTDEGRVASTGGPGGSEPDEENALFAPPWRRTPFAARPRGGLPTIEPDIADAVYDERQETIAAHVVDADAAVEDEPGIAPEMSADLSTLELPTRITRALEASGVKSVAALCEMLREGDGALLSLPGIGPTSVAEIHSRLAAER